MDEAVTPEDLRLLVGLLRDLRGWEQEALAREAGLDRSLISRYETGTLTPTEKSLRRIVRAVGVPMPIIEASLLPAIRALRLGVRTERDAADIEDGGGALATTIMGTVRSAVGDFLLGLRMKREPEREEGAALSAASRSAAAELWKRIAECTGEECRFLVETCSEFHTAALAERLSHESAEATSDTAARALELAKLAIRVAELSATAAPLRSRLAGYCLAFLANAQRVGNEMGEARETFGRARQLWELGSSDAGDVLPEWRFLSLEGSLRRDERRFDEALRALDRAFLTAPREAAGRILLQKGSTLEQMGEGGRAVEALREAAEFIDGARHPRDLWILRFNLAGSLCDLGRYEEADGLLPAVREGASRLGKELDGVRVRWLEGKVAAGLGRKGEARAFLEEVRWHFEEGGLPYDGALVTLELALLHLEDGRTGEVRRLAEEMIWLFDAQRIGREALAALTLFAEAVRREEATVELVRRILVEVKGRG
jgi:transcriptional regulator with XRE-family HTH domain